MNAQDELPVYIVSGPNWECAVGLDEDDATMNVFDQMMEAATKAIESAKGLAPIDTFNLLEDEVPYLGTTVHVFLKDTKPENGKFIATYIALGNAGLYNESMDAFQLLKEQEQEYEAQNEKEKKTVKNRNKKPQKAIKLRKKPKKDSNESDIR